LGGQAKALGGPVPAVAGARKTTRADAEAVLAKLPGKDVIGEIGRRQGVAVENAYAMALCLRELARPRRYREELGYASFEAMLAAHEELPSRMSAFKAITVVEVFEQDEVRRLGGMEKAYQLIRAYKRLHPKTDPRSVLEPGAKVLGQEVATLSARKLREALKEAGRPKAAETAAAKSAGRRLRGRFARHGVGGKVRIHVHDGVPCVSTHHATESAVALVELLLRLRAGPT
jgi:hypothetical protein